VDTDQSKLIFGSDEEFAAVKALNLCFPRATRVLCAKHLKNNTIDNLRKSLPQPEVTEIVSKLFGPSGILSSEDQVTFDELRDELTDTYDIQDLKLKVLSTPITEPDATADLSIVICWPVYNIILGGLDGLVAITSRIN
jgi:hypothetical protein